MPLIKSAIKKMRKDKKRTAENLVYVKKYKDIMKKIRQGGGDLKKIITNAYSLIDKAVKKNIIHKNKASRLKSGISKLAKKKK